MFWISGLCQHQRKRNDEIAPLQNSNPNILSIVRLHKQCTSETECSRPNWRLSSRFYFPTKCWHIANRFDIKNNNNMIVFIISNSVLDKLTYRCDKSRSWNFTPMCLGFQYICFLFYPNLSVLAFHKPAFHVLHTVYKYLIIDTVITIQDLEMSRLCVQSSWLRRYLNVYLSWIRRYLNQTHVWSHLAMARRAWKVFVFHCQCICRHSNDYWLKIASLLRFEGLAEHTVHVNYL